MIDKQRMIRLRKGFEYLEQYDELGTYPDKKIPVSITLTISLKHKLSKIKNVSQYIEHLIRKDLLG